MGAELGHAHCCGVQSMTAKPGEPQTPTTGTLTVNCWPHLSLSTEVSLTYRSGTHSINCYYYHHQCCLSIDGICTGTWGIRSININLKHEWNVQSEQEKVF